MEQIPNFMTSATSMLSASETTNKQHEVLPMTYRHMFVNKNDTTPLLQCPHCGYSGHGWQKFPKPSCCGKVSAILLAFLCMCCLPFCCDCSICWEWMCPSCHQMHFEKDDPMTELSTQDL